MWISGAIVGYLAITVLLWKRTGWKVGMLALTLGAVGAAAAVAAGSGWLPPMATRIARVGTSGAPTRPERSGGAAPPASAHAAMAPSHAAAPAAAVAEATSTATAEQTVPAHPPAATSADEPAPASTAAVAVTDCDLAADVNGGIIESITGFYGPGFNGRRLIDDKPEPTWSGDRLRDPADPIHEDSPARLPLDVVVSFYRHQPALVAAVAVTAGKDLARAPKEIEIWTATSASADAFTRAGGATLPPDAARHVVSFAPVEAAYVKVRILSNHQPPTSATKDRFVEMSRLQVLEGRRAGYMSLLDRLPEIADWTLSPRRAAQRGIEWLQPAAVAWGQVNKCFGCHVQAQAVMGFAVATSNDYVVSRQCLKDLVEFTAAQQQPDGGYIRPNERSTQFAAMGFAYWDELSDSGRNEALLKAADRLIAEQAPTGDTPNGPARCGPSTVSEGPFMTTANTAVALDRAFKETGDGRYKQAADRAVGWVASAAPVTTQDQIFKILTLARFGGADRRSIVQQGVERLIAEQDGSGGWRECPADPRLKVPNPYSTGQVLYAFKQAGVSTAASPFIKGVRYLLSSQREDGSWLAQPYTLHSRGARFAPTMWAVIGLAGSFGPVKTGGLQIVADAPKDRAQIQAARNLEIILDASGSMKLPLGTSTRIATARQVLRDVLDKLPDDFNVGLRLYAHRFSARARQTCTDTQLMVPMQKLDRSRIRSTVDKAQPKGETPLVYSVLQAPADLKSAGGGTVIVITDGEETCGGDPAKATWRLRAAGVPVTLNIVGFTLKSRDAERQMTQFAESNGGHYYRADDGAALGRALTLAALHRFPYKVFDREGKQVAAGQAGPLAETLPPGEYRVVVQAGDQELTRQVTIAIGGDVVLKVVRKGEQFVLEPDRAASVRSASPRSSG